MTPPLKAISSMATRLLLSDLCADFEQRTGQAVQVTSVGGVDAAKRVQNGEPFDLVFLASDALAKLAQAGHVLAQSVVPLVHSGVAVAVPAGAPVPDLSSEAALKQAVCEASVVGYSTGPSGVALLALFEAWGLLPQLQGRLLQAPAGVPVGQLVAQGQVTLGFQQLSELLHVPGITLAGPLPEAVQINTTFCGALGVHGQQHEMARELLRFMTSSQVDETKRRQGMRPA